MADTPPYLRVADALRPLAQSSEPGSKLPSISALTEQHGVSPGVVQRAYSVLIDEQLVIARMGTGYYVRSQATQEKLVRRQRASQGQGPSVAAALAEQKAVRSQRSESATDIASKAIAARLGITPGDPVMHTAYVYLVNGKPSYLADSWEPMAVTGSTLIILPEAGPHGGIGVIDRMAVLGIDVGQPVERVTARSMTRLEAHTLGATPGAPVLAIERTYYDQATGQPVETADIVLPGDRWISEYGSPPRPGQA